jgi:hypothetical protein
MLFADGHLELPNGKRINAPYASGQVRLPVGKEMGGRSVSLAKLVAKHFVENPEGYTQISYVDGNRLNCAASNIKWIPSRERQTKDIIWELRGKAIDLYVKGRPKNEIVAATGLNLNFINEVIHDFEASLIDAP